MTTHVAALTYNGRADFNRGKQRRSNGGHKSVGGAPLVFPKLLGLTAGLLCYLGSKVPQTGKKSVFLSKNCTFSSKAKNLSRFRKSFGAYIKFCFA